MPCSEPPGPNPGPDQDLDEPSRDEQALALRRQSLPYDEIASRLGWASKSSAFQAVQRAQAREQQESPQQARANISAQLDELGEAVRSIALGDGSAPDLRLRAAKGYLSVLDRKARLLGLDVPMVRVVEITEITEEAIANEKARIGAELRDAGFDLSLLPTSEQMAAQILATRSAPGGVEFVGVAGGVSLRRVETSNPKADEL